MQNILAHKKIFLIIIPLILLFSCEKDDNNEYIFGTNSIVNYLENNEEFSLFLEAIENANLYGILDGNSGTYTVLAPDNEAMQNYLDENQIENIEDIPEEELMQLIDYHILEILTPFEGFTTGYSPTLAAIAVNDSVDANLSLYVNNTIDEVEFNGKAKITESDIELDNGILHRIDYTLALPTLKTFIDADENLNLYYEKITAENISTDFEDILANPDQKSTILVPNEFAVETFFAEEGANMTAEELNKIYRYHLLDTVKLAQNFSNTYLTTKAKEEYSGENHALNLYVNTETGLDLNGESAIVISDLMTINGNIQVIDQVLSLPTVETFIKADSRFADFENALSLENQEDEDYFSLLAESTSGNNTPITVFSPENQAFDKLLEDFFDEEEDEFGEIEDINAAELTAILNLHFIKNQSLRSEDFSNQTLNTLGGNIELDADNFLLIDQTEKESDIIDVNIQTSNGVIHVINRVLRTD